MDSSRVHVVEPWGEPARSTGFVVVRRSTTPVATVNGLHLRFVTAAPAIIAACRLMSSDRSVLAALSDAMQRRIVTFDELLAAHLQAPNRNARRTDQALGYLSSGAASVPEVTFLTLVAASVHLPAPLCNPLLRLPDRRVISPDALFLDAGLIHETNGRVAHQRDDLFEDLQERHSALTAAGFTVLHNSPRRLALHGREAIGQVERCFLRQAGRGLPHGVELVRLAS